MKNYFIESFFGKSIDLLTLKDIEFFFSSEQEETSTLEFKSGETDIISLYKEITAFLNTEGGLIVVGAPREQKKRFEKVEKRICKGDLTFSNFSGKDWLIQKFYSNITPAPLGILVKEFFTNRGNIFLIEIPQSLTPPHQCNADGRYYIRMECEAKPAPHGLVQALFDKRKKPKLNSIINTSASRGNVNEIIISIVNDSDVPADKVSYLIDIYNVLSVESKDNFRSVIDRELGEKYSYSCSTSQVLPRFLEITNFLNIVHKSKPYVIAVMFYCKDSDFDGRWFLIDPITGLVNSEYNFFNDTMTLKELIANLE